MSIRTINETLKTARLMKKSRHPFMWSRGAVAKRACGLGAKIYGTAAPEIEVDWIRWRENGAVTLNEDDIKKIVLVARILELDANALFLRLMD